MRWKLGVPADEVGEEVIEILAPQRGRQSVESGVYRGGLGLVQHTHGGPEMDQHMRAPRLCADEQHGNARAFSPADAERLHVVA